VSPSSLFSLKENGGLSVVKSHSFIIKPDFDDDLKDIKARLDQCRDSLDAEHRAVAEDLGFEMDGKTLHWENHTLYGYCFRLTRKVRLWARFFVRISSVAEGAGAGKWPHTPQAPIRRDGEP
jgi:DNA mismatch repair ATPase MutS